MNTQEFDLIGVEGAAKRLNVSPWTMRAFAYRGQISSVKIGTRLMFRIADLATFVETRIRPAVK